MNSSSKSRVRRAWRVILVDGQITDLWGSKIVVTGSGDLMALDDVRSASPTRIIAQGSWRECTELGREAVGR